MPDDLARARKREQTRARQQRLRAQGRCIICGQPRRPGNRNYCEGHRTYYLRYHRAHTDQAAAYARVRAKRLAERQAHPNICEWCAQPIDPAQWPLRRKYHPACRIAHDRAVAAHPANPASHRRAARAWQARQRAAGRCTCCGKPRGKRGTTSLCRRCADQRNQQRKASHRRGSL